jgi:hypothetical protein
MASLTNGGLPTRLEFHELNNEERGARTGTRTGWAGRHRSAGLGPSGLGFGPVCSTVHLLHFGSWPLQLWALDVIIFATKLRDLYA